MDTIGIVIAAVDEEAVQQQEIKIQRRRLRDTCNPFDLDATLFRKNFRLNKDAFKYVLEELEAELEPGVLSTSMTPICRLSAVLRFLAEGGYQLGTGNDFKNAMAQSTISTNLSKVLQILERKLCPKWINLNMNDVETIEAKGEFYSKAGFPSVVMCVDGTHINIVAPAQEKALFYNRKGNFSLNVMLICDHKMKIRCVDAKYPGSNHDSHIWNLSNAKMHFKKKYDEGERNTWLLGDAGYPLEPWLMTPFRCVGDDRSKTKYNISHSKTRNIIERTIGVLKNRFRCILGARQLHYSPQKAAQIVNVVCALHNICIHFKVENYLDTIPEVSLNEEIHQGEHDQQTYRNAANTIRENIKNTFI
ncbi:putative nuclease HARBI1 [Eupeodes corollae]|uniref:putative nuclease HARBI1 n=1 Tax=Eupeodes corollae TaxID=290404 RepID=UPI002491698F|nr:putative nuclease HARBI1 [Eupeodes corollae]